MATTHTRYRRVFGMAIGRWTAEGLSFGQIAGRLPRYRTGLCRWKRENAELAAVHSLGVLVRALNRIDDELDDRQRKIRDRLEAGLYSPPRLQDELLDPLVEKLTGLGPRALTKAVRNNEGRELLLDVLDERE